MLSTNSHHHHGDELFDNPFAEASETDPFVSNTYIEPDIDLTGQSSSRMAKPSESPSSDYANPFAQGSIGSTNNNSRLTESQQQPMTPGTFEYEDLDTLDEPVSATLMRDLKQVARKLLQILHPNGSRNVLRDWDLWGPLILCLTLAIILSAGAPNDQAVAIFTGVFVIIWAGAAVVALNAKLLGGAVSFFQSVCVIGYCLFPLVGAAVVAIFVSLIWVRLPIAIFSFVWSTYASIGFLSESQVHLQGRRALAVYPLVLFYLVIFWLVLVS